MVTRKMNLVYAYTNLIFAALAGYGWYSGDFGLVSDAKLLFFAAVLGSIVFFWKARKRSSE